METQIESKWDPEVQRIITEGTAVTTAIRAAEDPAEVPEALRLVKKVRQDQSGVTRTDRPLRDGPKRSAEPEGM